MSSAMDEGFYQRADAHIALANDQCDSAGKGKVSASFLYAAARFNAYVAAINAGEQAQMREQRQGIVDFYLEQYRKMLEQHLDEYIENYERYLSRRTND